MSSESVESDGICREREKILDTIAGIWYLSFVAHNLYFNNKALRGFGAMVSTAAYALEAAKESFTVSGKSGAGQAPLYFGLGF